MSPGLKPSFLTDKQSQLSPGLSHQSPGM